jgi:shikimate dehydrogenase
MDRYVVIGNPVAHSRSPHIHSLFAQQTGQAISYERMLSPLDDFAATTLQFAASGGRGCNITVPFKHLAFGLAEHVSARAKLAQAANVLCFADPSFPAAAQAMGGIYADNTDGAGLVRDIEHNAHRPLRGKRVLLIGAGGASAGALGPLISSSPLEVVLTNRSLDKAQMLAARHSTLAQLHQCQLTSAPLTHCGQAFDIVINASASSLQGSAVPVSPEVLAPSSLALDMMYGHAAKPFLDWACQHGAVGRDGLGMLVEQAAEAFLLWRGVRPETAAVLEELRITL